MSTQKLIVPPGFLRRVTCGHLDRLALGFSETNSISLNFWSPMCHSEPYGKANTKARRSLCYIHALQRTPGFGVQLPSAALIRPAQSRAVLPAMKPGTARAFALRRRAHSRAPGPESLSLGSLGVFTRHE